MTDLRQRTIDGVAWSAGAKIARQVLTLVFLVVLARLLTPEEFGLVAAVTVITGFATIFAELGFGAALIHKQDATEEHWSSVFWLNVGAGLLLAVLFISAAPLVADLYDEPRLKAITQVIAVNFFLSSIAIRQTTFLQKQLHFRPIAIIEFISFFIGSIIAVAMALGGFGVWSLVAREIVSVAIRTCLLWFQSDWRPLPMFKWPAVRELLDFSTSRVGTASLNYWTRNLDNLLIGWSLGSGTLGIYSRAYSLLLLPVLNVTLVVSQVFFPSFATIQHDKQRVARAYLKATRLIALITFPLMLGLTMTARPFVLVVFGDQWGSMIPLVQIFGLVGMLESVSKLEGILYLSQGRAALQFRVGFALRINLVLGIVIGLQFGIVGVATGYAVASVINAYPSFYFAGRLVGLSFPQHVKNLTPVAACAMIMGVTVTCADSLVIPTGASLGLRLFLLITLGGAAYAILAHIANLIPYEELTRVFAMRNGYVRHTRSAHRNL